MATLVLSTVGTLVGGPIGGAVGALIGQSLDQRMLAPSRRGPRLGDLSVQTSSYGSAIPHIFGMLRVAGTVIWSTDLIEDRYKSGGGKGQPKVTNYSYSASFAVALSGRAIRGVGRIWADGKLLRGAGGDWKSGIAAFRLHHGGEGQPADPLIASLEGEAPAYRGIAYAVFEGLELADFGNRIPSLTFEVRADDGPVSLGAITAALSGGGLEGPATPLLAGFAATGDSLRGAIEALADALPLPLRDTGTALSLGTGAQITLSAEEAGTGGEAPAARLARSRDAAGTLPDEVAISYYEPARDWQASLQRARAGAGPGRRAMRVELPAALAAGEAKAIAEARLALHWTERRRATVRLPFQRMSIAPGDLVTVPELPGRWRVESAALDGMIVELGLVAHGAASALVLPAAAGRVTGDADLIAGQTVLALLDLPPLDGVPADRPQLWVAAAGTGVGWRRAALLVSLDEGASWAEAGGTAPAATMGWADTVLPAGSSLQFDMTGAVEVTLANDAMWLESRDDAALSRGANLAMLGGELIQFGVAEPLGARRFRLSRLLRGRRGSEGAMTHHAEGESFVLVERETLLPIDLPLAQIGRSVRVLAVGRGDTRDGVEAQAIVGARAVRPPAPVALTAERLPDGTVVVRWTRRSRTGWDWLDGADAPLGEEREAYRLTIGGRTEETGSPVWRYSPAAQAADRQTGPIAIAVRQLGTIAVSDPVEIVFGEEEES
ncbi:phage tail protein [Sphingomonas jatrophae]|uniref:Putative phage tail protein n=1 Tax=Sphingomonas jatrophae TaxID=1166337 RepID=A0A1I6L3D9_9SPHN|nr:phage tail protein [Sphingomonas jatrophae]SFR97966.1 Putative phage tail protein [Sphingomonas jatrophae]